MHRVNLLITNYILPDVFYYIFITQQKVNLHVLTSFMKIFFSIQIHFQA